MDKFLLMHKDTIVAGITIEKDDNDEGYLHVHKVGNVSLLPYGVKNTTFENIDNEITLWNDTRCIPMGRPNYKPFLDGIGLKNNAELLAHSYMCSLTDCYWFKPFGSDVHWKDVNFYDNRFSSNLYKHIFYGDDSEQVNTLNAPDITTDGALPKMWIERENGNFALVKSSLGSCPMDVYNEIIADAILTELNVPHVHYWIEEHNGSDCSVCECFIHSNNEEFVPLRNILRDYECTEPDFLPALRSAGLSIDLDKMMLADIIMGNTDRHAGNYGIILDSDTQSIKGFAPLFDHGVCNMIHDLSRARYRPTGETFGATLQKLDPHVLELASKINFDNIKNVIWSLPIDDNRKEQIARRLSDRIDAVNELIRGAEHDFDRSDRF